MGALFPRPATGGAPGPLPGAVGTRRSGGVATGIAPLPAAGGGAPLPFSTGADGGAAPRGAGAGPLPLSAGADGGAEPRFGVGGSGAASRPRGLGGVATRSGGLPGRGNPFGTTLGIFGAVVALAGGAGFVDFSSFWARPAAGARTRAALSAKASEASLAKPSKRDYLMELLQIGERCFGRRTRVSSPCRPYCLATPYYAAKRCGLSHAPFELGDRGASSNGSDQKAVSALLRGLNGNVSARRGRNASDRNHQCLVAAWNSLRNPDAELIQTGIAGSSDIQDV